MSVSSPTLGQENSTHRIRASHIVSMAMELLEQDLDEFDCFMPKLNASSMEAWPPIDLVTVYSTSDDSSEVSSYGDNTSEGRRSIFGSYWEKNGSISRLPFNELILPTQGAESRCGSCEPLLSDDEHENILRFLSSRRRIFGSSCWQLSESCLPSISEYSVRKSQSTPSLRISSRNSSCLRNGKFSSRSLQDMIISPPSDTSVSFSEDVDIVVFQEPLERWAPNGWAKWFA